MDIHERQQNIAYVAHRDRQEERFAYLREHCQRLLNSGAYLNEEGDIFYISWPDLPKEGLLPPNYVTISRVHPQANIYTQHSRYDIKEVIVKQVRKDEGAVETAIRLTDHVLYGEGREMRQTDAVLKRTDELFDFYTDTPVTDEALEAAREKTQALLVQVGLDPDKVIDEEKRRMAEWLLKGSTGEDALGRRNLLVTIGALTASYRRAIERKRGIGEITEKFLVMREALIFERKLARITFRTIADQLQPASSIVRLVNTPFPRSIETVVGMIHILQNELDHARVKTYRTVALEANRRLAEGIALVQQGKYQEVAQQNLFSEVRKLLEEELVKRADIYPQK